jgi:hypothetical protein
MFSRFILKAIVIETLEELHKHTAIMISKNVSTTIYTTKTVTTESG